MAFWHKDSQNREMEYEGPDKSLSIQPADSRPKWLYRAGESGHFKKQCHNNTGLAKNLVPVFLYKVMGKAHTLWSTQQ